MSKAHCDHCRRLSDAVKDLVSAMKMQEGREKEELHITQEVAKHIWDEAIIKAETALIVTGCME